MAPKIRAGGQNGQVRVFGKETQVERINEWFSRMVKCNTASHFSTKLASSS